MQYTPVEEDISTAPAPPAWSPPDQAWIVSDHATAALLLRDPECRSASPVDTLRAVARRAGRHYPDLDAVLAGTQIFQSGQMHGATRQVVRSFQARMRTRFPKARLDDVTRLLVAGLSAGEIEAVSILADALPILLFAESLDLDPIKIRLLRETGQALRALWRPMPPLSLYAELDAACWAARTTIASCEGFGDLRPEAGIDLDYPFQDLVLFLVSMPVDSTAGTIAAALALLSTEPRMQTFLRNQPAAIPGFVSEALRLHGPNRRLHRVLSETRDIAGVILPRGASVVIDLDRVHRDPLVYSEPERIVLDRRPQDSFGFGAGAHACQGASLGLLQPVSMLEALLPFWGLAPAASPARLVVDRNLRSYESLPLRLDPAHACSTAAGDII